MAVAMMPAGVTSYSPAYGGKPVVPTPTTTAAGAISGNVANLGQLYNLAGGINQFNQGSLVNELQSSLPGYAANIGQSSANTNALLEGQIPQDVLNQMAIQAAERGVATGSPGSPNSNAAYLAAIGRTSLDLMNQGEQNLTAEINRTPRAPLFNIPSMLVTPEQQQEAAAATNLYASAPDPAAAAAERLRLAQLGDAGNATRPTGGFMGVNRGGGGDASPLLTPYDSGGVVGPVGAFPNAITPSPYSGMPSFPTAPEGSAYATNPNVPEGATWNPQLGLYVDVTGQAFDEDGTPVGPAEGAQEALPESFYSDESESTD